MSIDAVKYGLDAFTPVAMRSEIKQLQGRIVLADYYNANPASMEAALATLMSLTMGRQAVAVLGDMLELGDSAIEAHRAIGRTIARLGVDILITTGRLAAHIARSAVEAGMPSERVFEAAAPAEAARLLKDHSRPGDAVLIKGSRGMKMEKILEEF
jgi:UDP-N-acetylmuramoyl-tripeptide--D-alanyl-D-alanine ligase